MPHLVGFCWIFFFIASFNLATANTHAHVNCDHPLWNSPAESNEGVFTGDLTAECRIEGGSGWNPKVLTLRQTIVDKIKSESEIHEGPFSFPSLFAPTLKWDVSHKLIEDGTSVYIRELILLSSPSANEIHYETKSKQVEGTGMASYLRSVQFSLKIVKMDKFVQIVFRNRVQVKRPWYALDLIFAPIARNVCFDKMEKVKEKFLPWILASLSESQ